MEIVGYIVYGIGIVLAGSWLYGIRKLTNSGLGVQMATVNTTMLFIVSLVLMPILKLSPFHLLWMYPASIVIGMLTLAFPFSLLSIPCQYVAWVACIGLNHEKVAIRKEQIHKIQELMITENISAEDAKKQIEESTNGAG